MHKIKQPGTIFRFRRCVGISNRFSQQLLIVILYGQTINYRFAFKQLVLICICGQVTSYFVVLT